jgi:hypothetical protein
VLTVSILRAITAGSTSETSVNLPVHTAQHPRRQPSSNSPPWECETYLAHVSFNSTLEFKTGKHWKAELQNQMFTFPRSKLLWDSIDIRFWTYKQIFHYNHKALQPLTKVNLRQECNLYGWQDIRKELYISRRNRITFFSREKAIKRYATFSYRSDYLTLNGFTCLRKAL